MAHLVQARDESICNVMPLRSRREIGEEMFAFSENIRMILVRW